MAEKASSRKTIFVIGFVGLIIGLGLAVIGVVWAQKNAKKSTIIEGWPTTQAYIIESKIMWDVERSRSSSGDSAAYFYKLAVTFGYEIKGRFFVSSTPGIESITDSIFFNRDPWENEPNESMIAFFKKVPQGCLVPAHVNPQNPNEAYIFPRLTFWQQYEFPVFMILFGLAFSAIPLTFIVIVVIFRKK